MRLARKSTNSFSGAKQSDRFPDGNVTLALYNVLDPVIPLVSVDWLLLPGLQAVKVTEHSRAFKEIDFPHLLGAELRRFADLSYSYVGL